MALRLRAWGPLDRGHVVSRLIVGMDGVIMGLTVLIAMLEKSSRLFKKCFSIEIRLQIEMVHSFFVFASFKVESTSNNDIALGLDLKSQLRQRCTRLLAS